MRSNKKRRFGKRRVMNEEMVLQITSMADIFTIILVFLLKSFATGASTITPASDIVLPSSISNSAVMDMPKLEISQKGILLEDKPVLELANYRFEPSQLETDGTARALNVIFQQKAKTTAGAPESSDAKAGLLVLADRRTPYTTLKTVLDTVAANGVSEFKLLVVEDQ